MMNKNAVSPLIAVVIVLMVTVALAAILISFGKGIIESETKNIEDIQLTGISCARDVSIGVITISEDDQICYKSDLIKGIFTNDGRTNIFGIQATIIQTNGSSETLTQSVPLSVGDSKNYTFIPNTEITGITLLRFHPIIRKGTTNYVCLENIDFDNSTDICT